MDLAIIIEKHEVDHKKSTSNAKLCASEGLVVYDEIFEENGAKRTLYGQRQKLLGL